MGNVFDVIIDKTGILPDYNLFSGGVTPDLRPRLGEKDDYTEIGQARLAVALFGKHFVFNERFGLYGYDGIRWKKGDAALFDLLERLTNEQAEFAERALTDFQAKRKTETTQAAAEVDLIPDDEPGMSQEEIDEANNKKRKDARIRAAEKLKPVKASLDAFVAFVNRMRTRARVNAVAELFSMMVRRVSVDDFDSDPFLLNCPSITVDLRNGDYKPHNPDDLITRVTAVDPFTFNGADDEVWQAFLDTVLKDRKEVQKALRYVAGMVLIGHVYEQKVIIAVGKGGNGKSTLFNVWDRVLSGLDGNSPDERGSYSDVVDSALFVSDKFHGDSGKRFQFADLRGKRLIISGETEKGREIDVATIKKITSTDNIKGELKHVQEKFTFTPSHTTILHTNHIPVIVDTEDEAITDRYFVITFKERIRGTATDTNNYADDLFSLCGSAVLRWMISGSVDFYNDGCRLFVPDEMKDEMQRFFDSCDPLKTFLRDECIQEPKATISTGKLYAKYKEYVSEPDGSESPNRSGFRKFNQRLREMGIYSKHTKTGAVYDGIRLREDDELTKQPLQITMDPNGFTVVPDDDPDMPF